MIQGRKVHFLPEHELPDSAKNEEVEVDEWAVDYCSLATSDPCIAVTATSKFQQVHQRRLQLQVL